MADLIINFQNFSNTTFYLDRHGKQLEKGGNSVEMWPGDGTTLDANFGAVQCVITQNLSTLAVGHCDFYCCWNDGHHRFGVKIHANNQMYGMGDRPEWYVMSDSHPGSGSIEWVANGGSPGTSYTWPGTVGHDIEAVPDSTHQGLTVNVTVKG